MVHQLALISGAPGTGKSTFGRWLEEQHGFAHVDLENDGLERFGLAPPRQRIARLPPDDVEPFLSALRQLDRPVVIDWGFPLPWFPLVRALHAAGVTAWWFDGDRVASRGIFIRRGTVPTQALDEQMACIAHHWPELAESYGDRAVPVVAADSTFIDPERILARLRSWLSPF
jgi:hypothetical protein